MALVKMILALILSCIAVSSSDACPDGWHQYRDKCFFFDSSEESSVVKNVLFCHKKNAEVASIRDEEENEFVKNMLYANERNSTRREHILGAEQVIHGARTFRWLDGTLFIYTNWAPGQPVGYRLRNHTYLSIKQNGKWTERGTADPLFHLCQIRLDNSKYAFNKSISQLAQALSDITLQVNRLDLSVSDLLANATENVLKTVKKTINESTVNIAASASETLKNFTGLIYKEEKDQDEKITALLDAYKEIDSKYRELEDKASLLSSMHDQLNELKQHEPNVRFLASQTTMSQNEIGKLRLNITSLQDQINVAMEKLSLSANITNETISKLSSPDFLKSNSGPVESEVSDSGHDNRILYVTQGITVICCLGTILTVYSICKRYYRKYTVFRMDDEVGGTMLLRP